MSWINFLFLLKKIKNLSPIPLFVSVQMDLVSTIGESVALGAAGIVFWGEAAYASNNVSTHTPHYIRNSAC